MLDESPTLDKNSKKLESFEQISMQLAGDGTKPKSGGVGVRWGLAGRILNGGRVLTRSNFIATNLTATVCLYDEVIYS